MTTLHCPLTHRLLQINLEIIYLLTGENYGPLKKEFDDHVTPSSSSDSSGGVVDIKSEERVDKKILELASNFIELLTNGKKLCKGAMMGSRQPLTSPESRSGGSHPPDSHCKAEERGSAPQPQTAEAILPQEGNTDRTAETSSYGDKHCLPRSDIWKPKDPLKCLQFKVEFLPHPDVSAPTNTEAIPVLIKEEAHPHPDITTPTHLIQAIPTLVKAEAHPMDEEHVLPPPISTAAHYAQSTPGHIMEESHCFGEEHLLPPEITTTPHHAQSTPTHIMEGPLPHKGKELLSHIDITLPEHETPLTSTGLNDDIDRSEEDPLSHNSSLGAQMGGQNGQVSKKSYFCTDCGKRFRYNTWFLAHQKTHIVSPAYCSDCNRHFSNMEALKRHLRAHNTPKAQCPECGKSFPTKTDLRNHQVIHAKTYRCSECGMTYSSHINFQKHQRMHQGEMVYHCTQCEKCFSNPDRLQRHQRIHTGERLFSCTECEQSFLDRCDLVKHMRIHTGERPFICLQCGSSFYNSSNFLRHWRAHSKTKP